MAEVLKLSHFNCCRQRSVGWMSNIITLNRPRLNKITSSADFPPNGDLSYIDFVVFVVVLRI